MINRKDLVADSELPVTEVLDQVFQGLRGGDELVLEAPPGAGKTTLVPLVLLDEPWLAKQKILLLEPRRLAARAAAERMASMLGERVGETVGYRMRLDTRVGSDTRIEVITEGVLNRMLQADPALDGIGLLIFDEFHERNMDSDLGLALALQGRELYRDSQRPLKLLAMSATLDGSAIAALLGDAPLVRCEGRIYPVEVHYGRTVKAAEPVVQPVLDTLWPLLSEPSTDSILVFLPGQAEIKRVADQLVAGLDKLPAGRRQAVDVAPLYGGLSLEQQRLAIEPAAAGRRKVVLATNIAETSLTIDGIATVVDAGLQRTPVFDPGTGMTRLRTGRISRASSLQRMGRAGRLAPGRCYRLWSEAQQQQMAEHAGPEILQADLAPLALQLLAWGVDDPTELDWLDPPPRGAWQQALDLLQQFAALEKTPGGRWQLTGHGSRMSAMPVHPRLAHMLVLGAGNGLRQPACDLAAMLSERDPLPGTGVDLWRRYALLRKSSGPRSLQGWRRRVGQQSKQYARLLGQGEGKKPPIIDVHDGLGLLLAWAYPDRIAKRRAGRVYQLANGRSARLDEDDELVNCEWLAVAELGGRAGVAVDRIFSAAELNPAFFADLLADRVGEESRVIWDDGAGRIVADTRRLVGAIQLDSRRLAAIPAGQRQLALLDMLRRRGIGVLPWNRGLRQWQARVLMLHRLEASADESAWPDVSDDALLATAEQWLLPYLDNIDGVAQLQKVDLAALLANLLPWPLPRQLEQMAPQRFKVPSGSLIEIDYSHNPPVLAVKLQEMFGCEQTPSVAGGRIQLLLHLLSPARRPLQVTQDLAGFWRTSYKDVVKDMKGRYPKHPWPDDPLATPPTRHVKNRR